MTVSECLTDAGWESAVVDELNCVPYYLTGDLATLPTSKDPDAIEFLLPYALRLRGWRHTMDWLMLRLCMHISVFLQSLVVQVETAVIVSALSYVPMVPARKIEEKGLSASCEASGYLQRQFCKMAVWYNSKGDKRTAAVRKAV